MKRNVLTLLGFTWMGFLIWLSFRNWHAAVFILLFQISLNTGQMNSSLKNWWKL
ncbi:membrane protein [Mycobacterium phage MrMiyagi]|uniref:Membrane protein n=1 Tax=Mycobacterium phage MrMiyagi TaxID=2762395 RepID=A0A7G8LPX8_9CAUD|nr:membrane protein [Mycobacterium phage MrMiyagi]